MHTTGLSACRKTLSATLPTSRWLRPVRQIDLHLFRRIVDQVNGPAQSHALFDIAQIGHIFVHELAQFGLPLLQRVLNHLILVLGRSILGEINVGQRQSIENLQGGAKLPCQGSGVA